LWRWRDWTVVSAVGVVVLWPRPPSRITRENLHRIREGMSRAEVEAILGPPGDFSTGPAEYGRHLVIEGDQSDFCVDRDWCWATDEGGTFVEFDVHGRVRSCSFISGQRAKQTFAENLLWRAKRQWHRWFP
jgi:hypothetical protein